MRPVDPRLPRLEEPDRESAAAPLHVRHTWIHKLGIFLFIIVCFEVGAFLTLFPWTPQWNSNSIANLFPWLRDLWVSTYFRGALSGLGVLNVYISLGEVSRLRRSGSAHPPSGRPPAGLLPANLPPAGHPPTDGLPPADKLKASTL